MLRARRMGRGKEDMGNPAFQLVATKAGQELVRFALEPGQYLIGRDRSCQITVPSPEISRQHARLTVSDGYCTLEDAGGKFGTRVDDRQIAGPVTLQAGQSFTLGRTTLELLALQAETTERYVRVRQLAKGGMGEVYLAHDHTLQRHVALKAMTPKMAANPDLAGRFAQEALVLGRLDHPHIVPIHDLGTDAQGQNYYAMKYVRGTTLKDVLTSLRKGQKHIVERYPLARLLEIFLKICDAIGYAHSKGIIHRDLKPANIMIGEFGEVLVMDWGIAKVLGQADAPAEANHPGGSGTLYGTVMGTPRFMAPEQAEGRLDAINAQTDIYSLGAILYNILTLRPPIAGEDSDAALMERVKAGQITPPIAFNADERDAAVLLHCPQQEIPEALSAVAMQALARNPVKRYPDVPALQRDIAAYTAGYAPLAERAGTLRQIRLTLRRNATLATAAAVVILVTLGFGIHAHLNSQAQEQKFARFVEAAPQSHQLATQLMARGDFLQAAESARLATQLDPDEGRYWHALARAQLAMQNPSEARKSLAQAKTLGTTDNFAKQADAFCDRLIKAHGPGPLPLHGMVEVAHWQHRHGMKMDTRFTLYRIKQEKAAALTTAQAGVKQLGLTGRVQQDAHGYLNLNLAGTRINNLQPFNRLPVTHLNLWSTQVADLQPLARMPLAELHVAYTPLRDLAPLRGRQLSTLTIAYSPVEDLRPLVGMPLKNLKLSSTRITDLSPLTKLPLQTLHLDRTPINNLKPLAGSPIRELRLDGCNNLRDLTPLAQCTNLETLTLPRTHGNITFLKNLPKLKRLSYHYDERGPVKVEPAAQFWRTHRQLAANR